MNMKILVRDMFIVIITIVIFFTIGIFIKKNKITTTIKKNLCHKYI